ncbi:MAG: general secretion pathway protein GspE, partial [Deltaproteobacteria bacterium]|nr:general secretion pathway protein GspE [Deltaproteobacteria bacterium]
MGGRLKLGHILLSKELIGPEQLAAALGEQERWGSRLGMT